MAGAGWKSYSTGDLISATATTGWGISNTHGGLG